jgi:methylated-DNA-[protein]-cysteine S-methyltransferase
MRTILIVSDDHNLVALDFDRPDGRLRRLLESRYGPNFILEDGHDPHGCAPALRAYLDGRFNAFDAILFDGGGTAFQQQCWQALCEIPAGETRSYGQMATHLGKHNAARAVGLANALNPLSIIVPCHRLIGSAGALTGYGGGIERKRWLLAHERGTLPPAQ